MRSVSGTRLLIAIFGAIVLAGGQLLFSSPPAFAATSGTVHLRFSRTVRGPMTTSKVAPRCQRDSSGTRIVNLSGKVGSGEYVVMIYARGPQTLGQFPVDPSPENAAAVTVQKVGTTSSPTATIYVATQGTVALKTATAGSLVVDLLTGGQNRLPLHVSGSWRCKSLRQVKS